MSNPKSELNQFVHQYARSKNLIDLPTTIVILLMIIGFPLLAWLEHSQNVPSWFALIIATWLMNLSFTAWHEPSHKNFSSIPWANNIAGSIASFASIYPAYFARRREHLIHHKWEGIDAMDPVYQRIQTNGLFNFPFTLFKKIINPQALGIPDSFLRITKWQHIADITSNLFSFSIILVAFLSGYGQTVFIIWIVPRIIIFLLHAYYICFFPHFINGGGYQLFRVQPDSFFWRFFTVNQHLHGIHHRWPWIPWHKYRKVYHQYKADLSSENIEVIKNHA